MRVINCLMAVGEVPLSFHRLDWYLPNTQHNAMVRATCGSYRPALAPLLIIFSHLPPRLPPFILCYAGVEQR